MSDSEYFSPFQIAARDAEQKFTVVATGVMDSAAYLTAEAGTGSRYAVVISRIPHAALSREGGQHLISVLQPWQTNMVFTLFPGDEIHPDYVLEKLLPRGKRAEDLHGGDAQALVMAVNKAAELFVREVG